MGNRNSQQQDTTTSPNSTNNSTSLIAPERKSVTMIKTMNPKLTNTVERKANLFHQLDQTALHFSKVIFDTISSIKLLLLDNENNFQDYNYDDILEKLKVVYLLIGFFTEHPNLRPGNRNLETAKAANEQALYDISDNLDEVFNGKLEMIESNSKTVFEKVRAFENKDSAEFQVDDPILVLQASFNQLKRGGFRFQDALEYLRIANVRLVEMSNNYISYYNGESTTYDGTKIQNAVQGTKEFLGYYLGERIFSLGWLSSDRTLDSKSKHYEDFIQNKLKPFERSLTRFKDDYKQCSNIIVETVRKFEYWDTPILKDVNDRISFYFHTTDEDSDDDSDSDTNNNEQTRVIGNRYDPSRIMTLRMEDCNMTSYLEFEQKAKKKLREIVNSDGSPVVDSTFVDDQRLSQDRTNNRRTIRRFKLDYVYEEPSLRNSPSTGPAPPPTEKAQLRDTFNIPNEKRFLFRSKRPFKLLSNRSTAREYFGFGSGRGEFESSTKTFQNGEVVHYLVSQFPLDFDRTDKANQRIRQVAINLEQICEKMRFNKFKEMEAEFAR